MVFAEKLKNERHKRGWSQEDLAEKLYVSRQSVSKWENGQNYPSIEIIIKVSDLFGVTIDELLKSDEDLTEKVIQDSRQLAYPKLKFVFDMTWLAGAAILLFKIAAFVFNYVTAVNIPLPGGSFLWNFGPLILMIGGAIGSSTLKDMYKKD
ncbi:transcriptional regulator [Alteribacter lacisalsi]|uniref:Transcriptional regulator n=1 Tax=Alteribacter lacisalsi TaxID=2045244 RepID=A0A2W0HG69_9BACI|nr:helix-turn-helix transcriptional regulator [Alteribacter lacisalsi]PYZ96385.1 transcriptional regulator [Alteribacter lacisalsi]